MTEYTKRHAARKQKSSKSAPANSNREPLAVYDGRQLLGTFLGDEKSGIVLAWDAERKLLGRFSDAKAAACAISDAALAASAQKAATNEALEQLNITGRRVCERIAGALSAEAIMLNVAVRIEDEIARRGITLVGRGPERCGPCPVCGGTDRFSINTRKQVFNCRGFGGGDLIALVQHLDGCDFKTAINTLGVEGRPSPAARPTPPPAQTPNRTQNENGARAGELWRTAVPIVGTLAEIYLASRGLEYADPKGDVLRFHGRCPFGAAVAHPCMIALFRSVTTDEPVGIHRTAIDPDGQKIDRMALGRVGGAAIKLSANEEIEHGLTIAEGIETTIAGMMMGFSPAWAVGFAGGVRSLPVLGGIETLTILVDHDEPDRNGRQAGHEAARECAERWMAAGREVRSVVPRRLGADMADLVKVGAPGE